MNHLVLFMATPPCCKLLPDVNFAEPGREFHPRRSLRLALAASLSLLRAAKMWRRPLLALATASLPTSWRSMLVEVLRSLEIAALKPDWFCLLRSGLRCLGPTSCG